MNDFTNSRKMKKEKTTFLNFQMNALFELVCPLKKGWGNR